MATATVLIYEGTGAATGGNATTNTSVDAAQRFSFSVLPDPTYV